MIYFAVAFVIGGVAQMTPITFPLRCRDFYCEKLDPKLLESVDYEHKEKMKILIRELERGTWTKKQKHRLFTRKGMAGEEIWISEILTDISEKIGNKNLCIKKRKYQLFSSTS